MIRFLCGAAQASLQPLHLIIEMDRLKELEQIAVAPADIEANAVMKLPQIHRTQVERPPVALLQMIGSVHQAVEVDTVLNTEHVTRFVSQHLAAPPQYQIVPIAAVDPIELWVVSDKTVDADAVAQ